MKVSPTAAYLLAVISMVIYSSPPAVTRSVSMSVPPIALSGSRWIIAALVLLPIVWRRLPAEWPNLKRHTPSLVFLGSFMIFGSTMSVLAVYYTTATNAVMVNASQPAITALLAWAIAGSTLLGRQRLGIACAFFGILVIVARADLGVLLGLDLNIGDPIFLLGVIGWSTYAVLLPRRDYAPDGLVLMFFIAVTGTVLTLPVYLAEAAVVGGFSLTMEVVAAMLYLSIFPTLLATICWNLAIRAVGPNRTAIFVNIIPISGATLAMLFLGERLYAYHVVGAAFVLAGIYMAVRRDRSAAKDS
ncbi:MAG TPA: DMT family transporter [Gammaproteobacteria bacterium]